MTPDEARVGARGTWEDEDEFMTQLGERIRAARMAAGITQTELAKHLGLSRSSIANIESAHQGLTLWNLAQLVALLGVEAPGLPYDSARLALDEKRARLAEENRRLRRQISAIRGIINGDARFARLLPDGDQP
jgi:transcriptional regulator with XRE-family HTH domain